MQNLALDTATPLAVPAVPATATPDQDPAGGITLTGRSWAGARARVLAGVVLTAGLVAVAGGGDTVSSIHHASLL